MKVKNEIKNLELTVVRLIQTEQLPNLFTIYVLVRLLKSKGIVIENVNMEDKDVVFVVEELLSQEPYGNLIKKLGPMAFCYCPTEDQVID